MYFGDIEVFTSTSKKCLRGVQQGVGAEIDVIGNDIERLILVPGPLDVLQDKSGFADTLLPQDAEDADIPLHK